MSSPGTPDESSGIDRRTTSDRRARPTRWWDSLLGRNRRPRGRREGENKNIYVDLYRNADLILIATVFALNCLDAGLTLQLVYNGHAEEANPVMAHLLARGTSVFLFEKIVFVGFCLAALVIHKTFAIARYGVYALLFSYGCLTVYHLFLQVHVATAGS